jgi:hypothetical protein
MVKGPWRGASSCGLLLLGTLTVLVPTATAVDCQADAYTLSWPAGVGLLHELSGEVDVPLTVTRDPDDDCDARASIYVYPGKGLDHADDFVETTGPDVDVECVEGCGDNVEIPAGTSVHIITLEIFDDTVSEGTDGIENFHLHATNELPDESDHDQGAVTKDFEIHDDAGQVSFATNTGVFSGFERFVLDEDTFVTLKKTGEGATRPGMILHVHNNPPGDACGGPPATPGPDYDSAMIPITMGVDQDEKEFVIVLKDDNIPEPTEWVCLDILDNDGWGGSSRGTPFEASLQIIDDDGYTGTTSSSSSSSSSSPPIPGTAQIQFSTSAYSAGEDADTVTINVVRTGSTSGVAEVRWAATLGSATGDDFTAQNGVAVFSSGQVTRELTFAIPDDDVVDGAKTVLLSLSDAVGAVLGAPATATLTIVDDDTVTQTTTPSNDTPLPVVWAAGLLVAAAVRRRLA